MSEQPTGTPAPKQNAEIKPDAAELLSNYKKEMERKQENSEQRFAELQNSVNQVAELLKGTVPAQAAANPVPASPSLSEEDIYDPTKVKSYVSEEARRVAETQVKEFQENFYQQQQQLRANEQAKNQALVQLAQDYPELNEAGGDFQKGVLEALSGLPESIRETAEGYRMAVYQQAANQGLAPKSKRQAAPSTDFSFGGSSNAPKTDTLGVEIDPAIVETAKLMGMDVSSKEVLEDLAKRATRTNWNKAQEI